MRWCICPFQILFLLFNVGSCFFQVFCQGTSESLQRPDTGWVAGGRTENLTWKKKLLGTLYQGTIVTGRRSTDPLTSRIKCFLGISHFYYSGIHIYVHMLTFFSFLKSCKSGHFLCALKLFRIFPPKVLQYKNAKLKCLKWSLVVRIICYFLCLVLTIIILAL